MHKSLRQELEIKAQKCLDSFIKKTISLPDQAKLLALSENSPILAIAGKSSIYAFNITKDFTQMTKLEPPPQVSAPGFQINGICISRDGNNLLAVGGKYFVVWSLSNNQVLFSSMVDPHNSESQATSVAVGLDGKYAVVGSLKNMTVFNLYTKKEAASCYQLHRSNINCLIHIQDKIFASAGSRDRSVKIFDIQNWNVLCDYDNVHDNDVTCLIENGQYLFSGSLDAKIKVLAKPPKREIFHVFNVNNSVHSITIYSNLYIFAGLASGKIASLDLNNKMDLVDLDIHHQPVTGLETVGDRLISCSSDRTLHILEIEKDPTAFFFDRNISPITSLAISSAEQIITANENREISIYDLDHQEEIFAAKVDGTEPIRINITYDDYYVLCAHGTEVDCYDMITGTRYNILQDTVQGGVTCMSLLENKYLIASSFDKGIHIFDIEQKMHVETIQNAHNMQVSHIEAFKNCMVSASYDRSIKIWDFAVRRVIHIFEDAHSDDITAIVVAKSSGIICSTSFDRTIKLWSIDSKKWIHTFEHFSMYPILSMAISGDILVTGSEDGNLYLFNIQTKEKIGESPNQTNGAIRCMCPMPNDQVLLGTDDLRIIVYDVAKKDSVQQFKNMHQSSIQSIALLGGFIVSGSSDKSVNIIDPNEDEIVKSFQNIHNSTITSIVTTQQGFIITGSLDQAIKVIDPAYNEPLHIFGRLALGPFLNLECAHKQNIFAISSRAESKLLLFDIESKEYLGALRDSSETLCMRFSYDDNYLVTRCRDAKLNFYRIKKENQIKIDRKLQDQMKLELSIVAHFESTHAPLALSFDNKFFAFATAGNSIEVWDFEFKKQHHIIPKCHQLPITALAITPNCAFLISTSLDSTVKIFSLRHQHCIHTYRDVHSGTDIIHLVANDNYFVTTGRDQNIVITNLPCTESTVCVSDFGHLSPYSYVSISFIHNLLRARGKRIAEIVSKFPNLIIFPYFWNLLHLTSQSHSEAALEACVKYGVSFELDAFQKTPLHYVYPSLDKDDNEAADQKKSQKKALKINTAPEKERIQLANLYFSKMLLYLENDPNSFELVRAMSSLLSKLLLVIQPINTNKFLNNFALFDPQVPTNLKLRSHGTIRHKESSQFYISESPIFNKTIENELTTNKGQKKLVFKCFPFNWDYRIDSPEMLDLIKVLNLIQDEETLQCKAITALVEFLFRATIGYQYFMLVFYSIFMVVLSVRASYTTSQLFLEICVLIFGAILSAMEIIQFRALSLKYYLKDMWNFFDIITNLTVIATMIMILLDIERKIQAYFICAIILVGYWRWISYFRIWQKTRRLIKTVLYVVKDMWGYAILWAAVVYAFSFCFTQFSGITVYADQLLQTFNVIAIGQDTTTMSSEISVFYFIYTIIILLILMNILIAIISDSYDKIVMKSNLIDCKEKLPQILESMAMISWASKCYKRCKRSKNPKPLRPKKSSAKKVEDKNGSDGGDGPAPFMSPGRKKDTAGSWLNMMTTMRGMKKKIVERGYLFYVEEDLDERLDYWEGRINTINKGQKYYMKNLHKEVGNALERMEQSQMQRDQVVNERLNMLEENMERILDEIQMLNSRN